MPGRKRKPDHLKVVEGTARPDRTNPDAPEASKGAPVAPDWLSEIELAYWTKIVETLDGQGRASSDDDSIILLAALALAEVQTCSIMIEDMGRTYESHNEKGGKMVRGRPEVSQRADASRRAQSHLAELGLSPASIGKVSVGGKKDGNPFEALG